MSFLDGTVKLPAVGTVEKRYAAAGVAVTLAAAVWYIRTRKAAALAASSTSGAVATDSAGNTGVIDPATGFVTGSPQDLSALSGSDLSYQPVAGGGGGGNGGGNDSSIGTQVSNGPPFTDNAAWTQYALQQIAANAPDQDPSAATADLAAYLAGTQVTPDQATVIREALALAGPVPIVSPSGYPPSINMVGSPAGPGSTPPAPVTNVKASGITTTSVTLSWSAATGATGYAWQLAGKTGKSVATSVTVAGLTAGTTYTATVDATGPGGASTAATVTFTTHTAVPVPPPNAPTYAAVPVVKYTSSNPPWNSTISGIAGHYHTTAEAVWTDPKNAALRAKRGTEDKIEPGDTVYVRTS